MGCATSTVSPGKGATTNGIPKEKNSSTDKKHIVSNEHPNGHVEATKTNNSSLDWNKQTIDKNGNQLNSLSQTPVPKSVAFDVTLDGLDGALGGKKRPRKLQTLEPLSIPKLTVEQLQEKQRLADEKREKLKQRKINTSQKSSRRRRELHDAREFETKLFNKQIEVKAMQNSDDDVEVEKDAEYNAITDDTWLGIPDRTHHPDVEEYGLHKKVRQARPTGSAKTVDSYDAAFMRSGSQEVQKLQPILNLNNSVHVMNDDFFDS